MLSWTIFKKKAPQPAPTGTKHRRSSSSVNNVSTMSSAGAIMKSVSEANNSEPGAGSTTTTTTTTADSKNKKPAPAKLNVKKCVCCGTKLQFPDGLSYFKCSICETFHDLKPVTPPDGISINLDIIKQTILVDEQETPGSYNNLEGLFTSCFGSVDSLNASFPLEEQNKLSYSRPNVDLEQVREFFRVVFELPSEQPIKCIVVALLGLLKRLRHDIESPEDIKFLLIVLELPVFYSFSIFSAKGECVKFGRLQPKLLELLERTVGVLAHSPKRTRHYLLNWLSRFERAEFEPKVELLNAYVAHRLTLHYNNNRSGSRTSKRRSDAQDSKHSRSHSVPATSSISGAIQSYHNSQPSNIFSFPRSKKRRSGNDSNRIKGDLYGGDWKIASFLRVLAIFFNANTVAKYKIPISAFYNSMVDFVDVNTDFDGWQQLGVPTSTLSHHHFQNHTHHYHHNSRDATAMPAVRISAFNGFDFSIVHHPKVAFCQYPFMLSMGSKTRILEYDAKRQMEHKAQEAFFGSLDHKCPQSPFLYIRVRREHILQDSFEAFERQEDDLKKGLRIEFVGEPGVDAGGLRKEWFLLLVRELFHPSSGVFMEEEESRYCWFDLNTEHPLKYYKLTGVAIGLALYNSTILDINFPPVLFKKLLGCAYTLDDFTEFMPSFGRNLQYLLEYETDTDKEFDETFGLTFSVSVRKRTGEIVEEPLMYNGENIAVTRANRHDYVRKVMHYYLDISIRSQFEAFKLGFYNVVGGNALTLFRPEEIELLVRGSPETVDVEGLKSVTKYQQWVAPDGAGAESHLVIKWFWKYFAELEATQQRKLLMFVTGSDRIPATGITNMSFKIGCLGKDCDRLPTSHTCFNQLCLYEYSTRAKLETSLDIAINNSQGFGIK